MESGYFDVSAGVKPFLHTWSLAVEEQFYILWPLLLFVFYKSHKMSYILWGLILITASSFIGAMIYENQNPSAVFYLTPFRAYQFSVGGILGLSKSRYLGTAALVLGLISLAMLAFVVEGSRNGHFIAATLPTLAALLIIYGSCLLYTSDAADE